MKTAVDVGIAVSQCFDSKFKKPCISSFISRLMIWHSMLYSVNFYCNSRFCNIEIHNIILNDFLSVDLYR